MISEPHERTAELQKRPTAGGSSFQRTAGIAGLLTIAAGVTQMAIVGSTPVLSASANDVAAFYTNNGSANRIGVVMSALIGIPLAVYMVGVHRSMSVADRAFNSSWSTLFLFGAIMMSVTAGFAEALFAIATLRDGAGMDASMLRALNDGNQIAFATLGVWIAVATGSVAVATFRHHIRAPWYGWLCVACAGAGILAVIDTVSISTSGIFANIGFLVGVIVWVFVSSVLMLRDRD